LLFTVLLHLQKVGQYFLSEKKCKKSPHIPFITHGLTSKYGRTSRRITADTSTPHTLSRKLSPQIKKKLMPPAIRRTQIIIWAVSASGSLLQINYFVRRESSFLVTILLNERRQFANLIKLFLNTIVMMSFFERLNITGS
jgi:hypothetical protein